MYFISMYSVLNTLSEYTYFYISKKHYFIHFYCFFLKSLKAFSVSLSTTICRSYSTSVSSHIIFDVRIIVIFTKQLSKYSLTIAVLYKTPNTTVSIFSRLVENQKRDKMMGDFNIYGSIWWSNEWETKLSFGRLQVNIKKHFQLVLKN